MEYMSTNKPEEHDPHMFQKISISAIIFIAFCVALGFLWSSSTAGTGIALFIMLVVITSIIISMVLYFQKQKEVREAEEERIEQYEMNMQEITKQIVAHANLQTLQEMEQRSLNHYIAFVMSQWGYRADVPDQSRGHGIDAWLYQGAQQFATWITKDLQPITATQLQDFSETYITHPQIFGVYISLGVFSDGARAWIARHNQKIWLIDAVELLEIIRRTDTRTVPWDAGAMAPLPPRPVGY
jgi:predicted GNAT family acetyltransferase